jgi:hypothetical protein
MTLPKSASSKRTNLPRASDYSKSFRKDWERLAHSGRFDLKRLKELILLLIANDGVTSRNGVFSTVTAGVQKDALRRKILRLFLWDFAVRNPIF